MKLTFDQLPEAISSLFTKLENIEQLLLKKNEQQRESNSPLNIQQAAEFLNLSVPTVYALVSRLEVPVSKRGKRLYFSKDELREWIKKGRKKTVEEIESGNDFSSTSSKGGNYGR